MFYVTLCYPTMPRDNGLTRFRRRDEWITRFDDKFGFFSDESYSSCKSKFLIVIATWRLEEIRVKRIIIDVKKDRLCVSDTSIGRFPNRPGWFQNRSAGFPNGRSRVENLLKIAINSSGLQMRWSMYIFQ